MVLGKMKDLRKKNCSVHSTTSNWMILIGDVKARGYRIMNEKITDLDQLIFSSISLSMAIVVLTIESMSCRRNPTIFFPGWIISYHPKTFSPWPCLWPHNHP